MRNLDKVPERGDLIIIGFARPEGGSGGYARYIATCPPDWKYGTSIAESPIFSRIFIILSLAIRALGDCSFAKIKND